MDRSMMGEASDMPVMVKEQDIASMLAVKPSGVAINRLTVIVRAYHECQGFRPHTVEALCNAPLENYLQPYYRQLTIPNEWTLLDFGWLEPGLVGMITIKNVTGIGLQTNPTVQQAKEMAVQDLYLGIGRPDKDFVVRPKGIPFVAEKHSARELWVCAANTPVIIEVTMLAR